MASRRSASSTAGGCEQPARITCSSVHACRAIAPAMRGSAWPNRLVHQLLTASSVRLPSRSEEHTSELQSLMRISYAVFCLKKKKHTILKDTTYEIHTDKNT